jgi:aldose 1-epimerase
MVEDYGTLDGRPVRAVTLESGQLRAQVITYGARLTHLWTPDRDGTPGDIVLGHDTLEDYRATKTYFGATAGRYANRIRDGRFRLHGQDHQLDRNEGPNHLHGGSEGIDRQIWTLAEHSSTWATMTLASPDGDMGYPGHLDMATTYELGDDTLRITLSATTSRPTILNLVHHSYFNLAGEGDILGHELHVPAPFYTPVDDALLTTGEILSVHGTPFDFTTRKPIGRDIAAVGQGGYDHNWCLAGAGDDLRLTAEVYDPTTGRRMTLHATEPGVQIYTGGYLSPEVIGKNGLPSVRFGGFTLETQKFPGTPNHGHFPPCTLLPADTYTHEMVFRFSAD